MLGFTVAYPAENISPDFTKDVQPILEFHCVRCHKNGNAKGGLRIDNRDDFFKGGSDEESVIPGQPEASGMIRRILLRPIDDGHMPDKGRALNQSEIDTLVAWVKGGASWPNDITLTHREPEPPKRATMPEHPPETPQAAARQLDELILQMLKHDGIPSTATIDDLSFLRRVSIDIIGRIPKHSEIQTFLAWPADSRRNQLVNAWLEHPRFADRWSVFFADMLRIRSGQPGADRWLAWVHGSLRDGKPYDDMIRELIASSGRPNSTPPVGFLLAENANPLELGAITAQIFLGVQIGCAMCHDHPYDDWKQREFYEFAAFFGKTRQVGRGDRGSNYITEANDNAVMWPPEDQSAGKKRKPIDAKFPFAWVDFLEPPDYLRRFESHRSAHRQHTEAAKAEAALDELFDAVDTKTKNSVLTEARDESRALDVENDLYKTSELRGNLANHITDPRNPYFARAIVNRIWAEFIGHGFVEPIDNFSPYNDPVHGAAMDLLAQEFIASGFNIRELMRIILTSDTYQRRTLPANIPASEREKSERHFASAPARRMIGESLYDSIVAAGHLEKTKWPDGANLRTITREIRIRIDDPSRSQTASMQPAMEISSPHLDGYALEDSLELDFDRLQQRKTQTELSTMREAEDQRITARAMAAAAATETPPSMFEIRKITSQIDENPVFGSALRMASPADPAHFLRVFGQPSRESLGEFREHDPSMRQQLMMLNGRLTHEASRVGPHEPIHQALIKDPSHAIDIAYLETLTRMPTRHEKNRAMEILSAPGDPAEHMADLRWALLNCHEFRYIP